MATLRHLAAQRLARPIGSRSLFTTSSSAPPPSRLRTGVYSTILLFSTGLFAVYYLDSRSAIHRYFITPLVRRTLDAEAGHRFALGVLRSGLAPRDVVADDDRLKSTAWGMEVSNPVGIAAGFDKDGEAVDGLFHLGFSWVEVGSVTPKPQSGNPKPRVFHLLEDDAVINRYGFPSQGHVSVFSRLQSRIPTFFTSKNSESASFRPGSLLAVNLGKNKSSSAESIDDFIQGVRVFGPVSDVLVINVSSPNTPRLRGLQNRDMLESLLSGVTKARDSLTPANIVSHKPKLVLKIAPDLDEAQLRDMAEIIRGSGIDGVIVSNTTISRPSSLSDPNREEAGGLSGRPLFPLSLRATQILRAELPPSILLIGCGGIRSGKDALEYAKAGASFVQVYTEFGYDGVGFARRLKDEILAELGSNTTWEDVVKGAVTQHSWKGARSKVEDGTTAIQQLIAEAKALGMRLDRLAAS